MDNNYNYNLFKKVWGNIVIRNEIIFHSRLYNIHLNKQVSIELNNDSTIPQSMISNQYKYYSYIENIRLVNKRSDLKYKRVSEELTILPNVLPVNVSHLYIDMSYCVFLEFGSLINNGSLTSLVFNCVIKQVFKKGIIPDSVTSLKFQGLGNLNQTFKGGWLPSNLKTLSTSTGFSQSIRPDQLPSSLTELDLPRFYNGKIFYGSIPPSVKNLHYSNSGSNPDEIGRIPNGTISIKFDNQFNKEIKVGDIPHNVDTIDFGSSFNSRIEIGALPESIRTIKFGNGFKKKLKVGMLPCNLTCIDLGSFNRPLEIGLFPPTVTSIKFNYFQNQNGIPDGYFRQCTPNLQKLEMGYYYSKIIPVVSLPINSLTSLTMYLYGYPEPLVAGLFPLSLLELKLDNYNHPINENVLPPNLKKLYLTSRYTDKYFNQNLSNNNLPKSLQSIYISPDNKSFINTLDPEYLINYIKYD